jgi:DedD protein
MDKAHLQQRITGLFIWMIILGLMTILLNQGKPQADLVAQSKKILPNSQATTEKILSPLISEQQAQAIEERIKKIPAAPKISSASVGSLNNPKKQKQVSVKNVHQTTRVTSPSKSKKTVNHKAQRINKEWFVQLGSFSKKNNAERLKKLLINKGYSVSLYPIKQNHKTIVRVWVGPEKSRYSAKLLKKRIRKNMDIGGIIVSRK